MSHRPLMLKGALRNLTPPILWKAAAKFWRIKSTGSAPKWVKGVEQGPAFYDWSFEKNEHWRSHYTVSHYYPLWTVVADRIRRAEADAVLDIGCGPGQVASLLSDKGVSRYLGLDFSSARIQQARAVCPSYRFKVVDVFETDLLERWDYDCVLIMEFLEHVERDLEVLQRLRPGVRVIATVPSFPAIGHVRCFESAESVKERYHESFASLDVDTQLANTSGKRYFLMEGIMRKLRNSDV